MQVEKAKLQFAKVTQACKKEALKLSEALKQNEEELSIAKANLSNAEIAFKLLEDERTSKQLALEVQERTAEAERIDEDDRLAEALAESMQAMRPEKDRLNPGKTRDK